jgi:small subunit ribosomal protein S27Ae
MSLEQIKEVLLQQGSIASLEQNLIAGGMIVSSSTGLKEGTNVFVDADLDGGKKKKKKKVYTTKKKGKHIHKKEKMHTLKLYGIEKDTVTYLRKTCPTCGPGIFMAKHWDRYYCGLCHTTVKMDAETIRQNEEIIRKKREKLEAERKLKEKEAADKAPAAKGKAAAKGAKKGKK